MISYKPLLGYLAYHNISKAELARKMGISTVALYRDINENCVNANMLNKICLTLNIGIKDVIRYEE